MKRMDGVAVGLVSDVDAKLGRIKVKFPWMDPPQKSHWAPIASVLSGKKRGARFMPELEDEALIAFDRGEFDHPYVVGFLWNGQDEAPDDVKTNRLIVTPGGHELRFEDKDGERRIQVKTADGHTLTFDDKGKSITLESKQQHQLEILDKDGKVTLKTKSGGKVTLENQPGKVVVEASQNKITLAPEGITIDCTAGTLSINANAATTIKSTAMMSIEASGVMSIKSGGPVTLNASALSVTAGMATFSGVVQASTILATSVVASSVVSGTYSPGVGNLL